MKPNNSGDGRSISPSRSQKSSTTSASSTTSRIPFLGRLFSFGRSKRKNKATTKKSTLMQEEKTDLIPSTSSSIRAVPENPSVLHSLSIENGSLDGSDGGVWRGQPAQSEPEVAECFVCFDRLTGAELPLFTKCDHKSCTSCLKFYLMLELDEGRLPTCMACSTIIHPLDVQNVFDSSYQEKYETYSLRHFMQLQPDTRWCPKPDCGFALIANDYASCPKITCQRVACQTEFCYHCRQYWHPNQSCDQAQITNILFRPTPLLPGAASRRNVMFPFRPAQLFAQRPSNTFSLPSLNNSDIKQCPRCGTLISKMDDGSCNHITCNCGCEFCWLCLKEISDLHYLSPSGCTFWGKQVWSKKKIVIWQIGTLVLAPPMIGLMAGVAIPATIVGVPIWIGRQIRSKLKKNRSLTNKKRRALVGLGSSVALLLSPLVAGITVGVGVPVVLLYVYGVIPITLCRTGGCGVTMPTQTALRLLRNTPGNSQSNNANTDPEKPGANPPGVHFSQPSEAGGIWAGDYSVNQSDDFSVQSVNGLDNGSPINPSGDIASTYALASFCSNSINGSAIIQSQDTYNSASASICSKGRMRKIPVIVQDSRNKTPSISRSEIGQDDERNNLVQKELTG